ncbi:RNA methyltransferase [Halobacteriales archaeon QS_4_62_28]|nr:MAG: RNA methyltransferase [Halobacteriales archaeon QS_4_62_28]
MATKRALAQQLGVVAGFDNPRAPLEQYRTPPELAAHLVHLADLRGDIADRTIVDLGCGTGMLALGAALRGPERTVGLDIDPDPLQTARENERKVASSTSVSWVRGDASQAPLSTDRAKTTVVMNPPFGAQSRNEHADREFLATTAAIADVSYSIHNEGSQEFVGSFAEDNGGTVTDSYLTEFEIPRQFDHHDDDSRAVAAEVYRIEW